MNTAFEIKDLSYRYDTQMALSSISLHLPCGCFTAILGPNGSGKSTLLKLCSKALPSTKGSILLGGRDIHSFSARNFARQVAFVPQETHLPFDFTVREMVLMGRYAHSKLLGSQTKEDFEIVEECMHITQVHHLADRSIATLSGGERQRAVLSRALAQQTPYLLLDEPVSSLDIRHRVDLLCLLKKLTAQGKSIVCVLHDINEALAISDQAVILNHGKIALQGATKEIITPKNLSEIYEIDLLATGAFLMPDYRLELSKIDTPILRFFDKKFI